jgi:hypothetical protein
MTGLFLWPRLLICNALLIVEMLLKILAFGLAGYWHTLSLRADGLAAVLSLCGALLMQVTNHAIN